MSDLIEKGKKDELPPPKEPHLLDLGNLLEIAQWFALAAASGVVGNAAHDLLKNIKRRFGTPRIVELEEKVYEVMDQEDLSDEARKARIRTIFSEFK